MEQGGFRGWRGRDATRVGKPAQTASQGQTAGNRLGGPLGPLAFLSHLHFRSIFLLRSLALCQPLGAIVLQRQPSLLLAVVLHLPQMDGHRLNFYLETGFDVDKVFGTRTAKRAEQMNLYANYDMSAGQVCDELELVLVHASGKEEALTYPLNAVEKAALPPH